MIGDSYEYFPKKIQKKINPVWFFFENLGPLGYNIEFLPVIITSAYILIKTIVKILYI